MKSLTKLILLFLITAMYVYYTGFELINNLPVQLLVLLLVLLLCSIRFRFKKVLNEIRLMLPFITFMLLIYAILGIVGFSFAGNMLSDSRVVSALVFGAIRCVLFVSTMLFFQFILSFVSMQNILNLPYGMRFKKSMILGRALFIHSLRYLEEMEDFLKLMPEYQKHRLSFRQWYRLKLQLTLALIFMLLRESYLKGELIDNRIRHCFDFQSGEVK